MKRRITSGSRSGIAVRLLVLLGIGHSAPAFAQADGGAVSILGRTFSCSSSTSCSAVSAETSPYYYVSNRDAGFSARINTDRYGGETYLWVFGDTPLYQRDDSGAYAALRGGFWETNTGALTLYNPWQSSPPAATQKTLTGMTIRNVDGAYEWTELVPRDLSGAYVPNCTDHAYPAAWPDSIVSLPGETNATLRDSTKPATAAVLIFFQDMCAHATGEITRYGTGVAAFTWSSNASDDPDQQFKPSATASHGLQATVLTRTLFSNAPNDSGFQYGATVDDLGALGKWLRVLRCHDKDLSNPAAQPQVGCELAQVQLNGDFQQDRQRIADVDNWTYLRDPFATSDGWKHFGQDATGAGLPPSDAYDLTRSGGLQHDPAGNLTYPALSPTGHTSLVYYAPKKVWVLISMIVGYDASVVVYTAKTITGPWSAPKKLTLPAPCTTGEGCYAPTFHAELNASGSLGFSYVDNDGQTVTDQNGAIRSVQQMRYGSIADTLLPAAP